MGRIVSFLDLPYNCRKIDIGSFYYNQEDRKCRLLANNVFLCRSRSGLSPNAAGAGTFYNWVSRCRKAAADQIPAPSYGHQDSPRPKQDVVAIDLVPDTIPEQSGAPAALQADMDLDNSHTIEITMQSMSIRIKNDVDPALLTRTFRLLQEFTC